MKNKIEPSSCYKQFILSLDFTFIYIHIYIYIYIYINFVFYSTLVGAFLRIACSSLLYKDFNEKVMELLYRMKAQRA